MDRHTFLKSCCLGVCGLAALGPAVAGATREKTAGSRPDPADREKSEGSRPDPADERFEAKAHRWIADMMRGLDTHADAATRTRIMQAQGRACYAWFDDNVAHTSEKFKGNLDAFCAAVGKAVGPDNLRREGNTIFFNYVGSPEGKRVDKGQCLCPLVENAPAGLSPTFCECSIGYVSEMFGRVAGKPAQVQLLEALKRGGQKCRFRVTV